MADEQIVVGLDIGTTKVVALIGEVSRPHLVQVVGHGIVPSRGLRKGLVVDMDEAVEAITSSLKKAESFSGYRIMGAFVAVSGAHLDSEVVTGSLDLSGDRPVTREEALMVLDNARPNPMSGGRQLLHLLPRGYTVDGENGIRNPVGMLASCLEVEGVAVSSAVAPLQNLTRCIDATTIKVDNFVCAGMASAQGVLSEPERQLGVLLMDIGGGTTDLAWFRKGEVQFAGALPIGGNHITNDLAVGLGVPFSAAEEIKRRFASAVPGNVTDDETVDAGAFGDGQTRKVSRRFMAEIVEARVSEIFSMAMWGLENRGYDGVLPAGVVLTGGSAQLRGIRELAQQYFKTPVRIGSPEGLAGAIDSINSPAYSTAAGLLKWAHVQGDELPVARPLRKRMGVGARMRGLFKAFLP